MHYQDAGELRVEWPLTVLLFKHWPAINAWVYSFCTDTATFKNKCTLGGISDLLKLVSVFQKEEKSVTYFLNVFKLATYI